MESRRRFVAVEIKGIIIVLLMMVMKLLVVKTGRVVIKGMRVVKAGEVWDWGVGDVVVEVVVVVKVGVEGRRV